MSIGEGRLEKAGLGGAGRRFAAFLFFAAIRLFGRACDAVATAENMRKTSDGREGFLFDFENGTKEGWKFSLVIIVAIAVFFAAVPLEAAVVYVDSSAAGANNGGSWTDAFTDLQDALGGAASGDEI